MKHHIYLYCTRKQQYRASVLCPRCKFYQDDFEGFRHCRIFRVNEVAVRKSRHEHFLSKFGEQRRLASKKVMAGRDLKEAIE